IDLDLLAGDARLALQALQGVVCAETLEALDVIHHQVAHGVREAVERRIARLLQLGADLPVHAELALLHQPAVDRVCGHQGAQLLAGGRVDQAAHDQVDGPAGALRPDLPLGGGLGHACASVSRSNPTKRYGRWSWCPRNCMEDRKSTRLNSSHVKISYAVFCLK